MRFGFRRKEKPGPLTVDKIQKRLEQEAREEDAARSALADAPTRQRPAVPMHYGHGQLPKWVRRKAMEDSARFDWPEVTP